MSGDGVRCPDCGAQVPVPAGACAGDLVECPNCAGHALRFHREGSGWGATLAHRASCPACDEVLTVPDMGVFPMGYLMSNTCPRLRVDEAKVAVLTATQMPYW
jgi:hypothetical protein